MVEKKIQMVCDECGSTNVQADAYASWDVDAQEWTLDTTFDKGSCCNDCEATDCIIEKPA